jgi:hypothetical protein
MGLVASLNFATILAFLAKTAPEGPWLQAGPGWFWLVGVVPSLPGGCRRRCRLSPPHNGCVNCCFDRGCLLSGAGRPQHVPPPRPEQGGTVRQPAKVVHPSVHLVGHTGNPVSPEEPVEGRGGGRRGHAPSDRWGTGSFLSGSPLV